MSPFALVKALRRTSGIEPLSETACTLMIRKQTINNARITMRAGTLALFRNRT
jgi:hypothetical protein